MPDNPPIVSAPEPKDAPPEPRMTGRQKAWLVVLVVLKRVRFIAILVAVGMFIGYWDTIKNYWDKWTRPRAVAVRQLEAGQEFYCPMHPQVVRSTFEPNGDVPKCPICGMPLSVRKKGEALPLPLGVTGRVQFSPERIQLAGIKTVPVEYRSLSQETTTVGYVTFDESRLSRVVSRVAGYVEKLYVDKSLTMVREGDPLAEIYSPELYSAAQELILATQREGLADLAASARKKLSLLGVAPQEIDSLVASGKATPRLVLRSPRSGYVMEKRVVAGSSVEMGMTLLEVADLSSVWVEAEVYEKDIGLLQLGQKVEATVEAFPNRAFAGSIALIAPSLDAATRTSRVRFALENAGHELRPGMFATVRITTPLETIEPFKSLAASRAQAKFASSGGTPIPQQHDILAVPERAVVDSGTKKVVYVEREPGLFEGVEVELGPRSGEYYPVVKGLAPGDKIAAAGGFLIDAETRLNPAAASTYFGATGAPQSGGGRTAPAPGRPGQSSAPAATSRTADAAGGGAPQVQPVELSPEQLANIDKLPPEDRAVALAQRACPITGAALGSMGPPHKIRIKGQVVMLCCKGCAAKAINNAQQTLEKVAQLKGLRTK